LPAGWRAHGDRLRGRVEGESLVLGERGGVMRGRLEVVGAAFAVVVLAGLAPVGCGRGDEAAAPALVERSVAVRLAARRRADDLRDTLPIFRAATLTGWGDSVLVLDGGNDRLV